MSHPTEGLKIVSFRLKSVRPGFKVELQEGTRNLLIKDVIKCAVGSCWTRLPSEYEVIMQFGSVMKPKDGKAYMISVNTIDPFHVICEASVR